MLIKDNTCKIIKTSSNDSLLLAPNTLKKDHKCLIEPYLTSSSKNIKNLHLYPSKYYPIYLLDLFPLVEDLFILL